MVRIKKKTKKYNNRISKYFYILSIFLILVLLLYILSFSTYQTDTTNYEEMKVRDVIYMEENALVVLSNGYYDFTFYTTREQGESIKLALQNKKTQRPNTHDTFVSSLRNFGISVDNLRITKLVEETYYGELTLRQFLFSKKIDLRPSDGVAIALRTEAKIYINKDLLSKTKPETLIVPQTVL